MTSAEAVEEVLGLASELPNFKFEPEDSSQEPGGLQIDNVFSISSEFFRDSCENLVNTSRYSNELMTENFVIEPLNNVTLEHAIEDGRFGLRESPGSTQTFDNLDKPDSPSLVQITKPKLKRQLKSQYLTISIVKEPVSQSHEDLSGFSRSSDILATGTSVTEASYELPPEDSTSDKSYSVGTEIGKVQSSDEALQERNNSQLPDKSQQNFKPFRQNRSQSCDFCSLLFFSLGSLEEHVADVHVVDKEFSCTECNKSFITQERLATHMSDHEKAKEANSCNKCPICSKTFVSKKRSNLTKHMLSHQAVRPFKCQSCPKSYVERKDLEAHQMNQHGKPKKFKCPKCSKSYAVKRDFEDHLLSHSDVKTVVCECCHESFKTRYILKRHRQKCKGPKSTQGELEKSEKIRSLKCPICSKIFFSKKPSYLNRHMLIHRAVRPFKCELCPKSFVDRRDLDVHGMNRHGKPKTFKCTLCPKSFSRKFVLEDHLRAHSDEKTIVCGTCSESFKTKYSLDHHRRTCKGPSSTEGLKLSRAVKDEKAPCLRCPNCPRTFKSKQCLHRHKLIHLSVKPLTCPVCFKVFAFRRYLKRHMSSHDAFRPFKCQLCPNSYIESRELEVHEMSQHGKPKKFNCTQCPKSFTRKFIFEDHLRTHSKEKTIPCENCSESFRTKSSLKHHRLSCKGVSSTESLQIKMET